MMQSTFFALPAADQQQVAYPLSAQDDMAHYISYTDIASRPPHRGSNVQRPAGAMRVVKPSSTSNSPQARAARRRTMMADSNIARRRGQQIDHNTLQQHFQQHTSFGTATEEQSKRSSRPVSWHPSSNPQVYQQQQQQIERIQQQRGQHLPQQNNPCYNTYLHQAPTYTLPTPLAYAEEDHYTRYQTIPPTPAQFSAQNSPLSGFTPLIPTSTSAAANSESPPHYFAPAIWNQTQRPLYADATGCGGSPDALEAFPPLPTSSAETWDDVQQGAFYGGVTPPTPQNMQSAQHHEAIAVPPEDSIPYEPLQGSEDEGEILIGMGLYEDPEKTDTDPWLDNYRRTTTELLGSTYRRVGQGLKLEESWEPPASDDENDNEDSNSERDADGEEHDGEQSCEETWI
ncbi:hypothetical protein Micbo1qcDRAFT_161063 [Microdochium bolleyi]|uniref:Uncharacterized protein n=1 Tax=Microdochium bolleyi TaxID=196109 RepID=A0A136J7I1_9PEZI|nr:hypothetical protein Micbo1qcDRAFT_161063 [Microdochium bolleyi]